MTAEPPRGLPAADPEKVLSQALRAMAGGRSNGARSTTRGAAEPVPSSRLTVAQILLLAAIIGVVIGMGAGLLTIAL